jgi:hypothetical protein
VSGGVQPNHRLRRQQQEGDERHEAPPASPFDDASVVCEDHPMIRSGTIWITITGSQGGDKFPGLLIFRRDPKPRPGREIG